MRYKYYNILLIALATAIIFQLTACAPTRPESANAGSEAGASQVDSAVSYSEAPASSKAPASSAAASTPRVIEGFVRLTDLDSDFIIDLKYATVDNFTHKRVYPTDVCVLRLASAQKLAKAEAAFEAMGYRLKIWDAYRPLSVQKIFWSIEPDERYVANPYTGGSIHNRGCAVDLTLADLNGRELEMPTGFDDFTGAACPDSPDMTAKARADLDILQKGMENAGFEPIATEWWHFQDADWADYPVSDIDLTQFE